MEIHSGNYDTASHTWTGTFRLTSIEDNAVTLIGNTVSIEVNNDMETYLKQNLQRELNKLDTNYKDLKKLDLSDHDFKSELKYYSKNYLEGLLSSFHDCLAIIVDSNIPELRSKYEAWYYNHIGYIEYEIGERDRYLNSVHDLYDYEDQSGVIYDIQQTLKDELDFESYLGSDLWKVFCSYRMEDTYKNDNYISDGLDNGQLISRANDLIDMAKKELYKSSHIQYAVHSTINNLLALPEFQPLIDDFAVGNWIHVCVDEKIYFLRLLSYHIYFDDIPKIDVEFSTVEKTWSGASDIDNTLKSAQNIASSYRNETQKIKNHTASSKYVENWVQKGLDATATKIVNNAYNQSVIYDSSGILCRNYDDITNDYDLCALRVLNSGIYVTDDNWKSIKGAIGKYIYTDPLTAEEKTVMGVLAETIVGKFFLGENLGIYTANGRLKLDKDGFNVNERFKVDMDGNVTLPDNATISWSNVTGTDNVAVKSDIPTDTYITTIAQNSITTEWLNAKGITAKDFSCFHN